MNSPIACLATLVAAAFVAASPHDPPADESSQSETIATWKERATRAQAWLKAKSLEAEQAAADAMARARLELLGVDGPVHEPTLALAVRPGDRMPPETASLEWVGFADLISGSNAPLAQEIVLLVHGLDEPGSIWDELTPHLLDHGATVVRLDYPNDQGIADSGRDLLDALCDLRARGVQRVSIVAHSMGGLVARDALTRADGYAGNGRAHAGLGLPAVIRVIMVGTPNNGAPLAKLQPVADAREQVVRRVQNNTSEGAGLLGSRTDGQGEAGRDLATGSEFLVALNALPNPVGVKFTTIGGTLTPAAACEYLKTSAQAQWATYLGEDRAAALILQTCAAVETLGDGMVPCESTRLKGFEDHVEIAADHRSMLKRWTILNKLDELRGKVTPPALAIPIILDRLGLKPLPASIGEGPDAPKPPDAPAGPKP